LYFTDNRDDLVPGPDGRLKVLVTFAIANNGDPYGPGYTYRVRVRGAVGRPEYIQDFAPIGGP
jgi:hypothetical protein